MTVERYLMEALKTAPVYVEDVFSTYLYTGNGSGGQTIPNNIDLSTKGGMIWMKTRARTAGDVYSNHFIWDTVRGNGALKYLYTNTTGAEGSDGNYGGGVTFNTNGFITSPANNQNTETYASWTFRKQPKFFDVVTWTGNGAASRQINHNLGSIPGMIIVKCTSNTTNWPVYHNGLGGGVNPQDYTIYLNLTNDGTGGGRWAGTAPTATQFSVNNDNSVNFNNYTYVAYLFAASNSGGFGLSGSNSVVACGSATTDASQNATITLGWEPQYVLLKRADAASQWAVFDTMRGWASAGTAYLQPNNSNAEGNYGATPVGMPTATGFTMQNFNANATWIYMAIRRGPMKVPTSGTSVYNPVAYSGTNVGYRSITTTNTPDIVWWASRNGVSYTSKYSFDRLRGVANSGGSGAGGNLTLNATDAEYANSAYQIDQLNNISLRFGSTAYYGFDQTGLDGILWNFSRAPGFMDEVCYTGTGSATTQAHNLGVVPEMMIVKDRTTISSWWCYHSILGASTPIILNSDGGSTSNSVTFNATAPTASVFSLGTAGSTNGSGDKYVAYLFATCPGVSKVGSYTGTGAAQNINCGFAAGARFVLIKRTDSTGDWYVYDSARGISSGNDPYLLLNSTAAEVTGTNYVDTFASGFTLTAGAPAALNANGGSFIFLAIS